MDQSDPAAVSPTAGDPDRPSRGDDRENARPFAIEAARLLADLHCEDVLLFDVRKLSDLTDFIIIATGTSDRQIKSLGKDVEEVGEKYSYEAFGKELDDNASWHVVDFVDVVVHLFSPEMRGHYDLEMLWGDAERVRWRRESRPAESPPDTEG